MKMTLKSASFLAIFVAISSFVAMRPGSAEQSDNQAASDDIVAASTVSEARGRALLLHETIHGMLQIMHRDFFDEDDAHSIPSASMEDVFHELERSQGVTVNWLVVNTDVVNVDHRPRDDFEKAAAKALAAGKPRHESFEDSGTAGPSHYRYAGPIRLRSQCLKCHVKIRTSNEDRVAGLVISMPVVGDADK